MILSDRLNERIKSSLRCSILFFFSSMINNPWWEPTQSSSPKQTTSRKNVFRSPGKGIVVSTLVRVSYLNSSPSWIASTMASSWKHILIIFLLANDFPLRSVRYCSKESLSWLYLNNPTPEVPTQTSPSLLTAIHSGLSFLKLLLSVIG